MSALHHDIIRAQPTAERAEDFAAGVTGAACPFCGARCARILKEQDRQGTIAATWKCDNCDESGECLPNGILHWEAS